MTTQNNIITSIGTTPDYFSLRDDFRSQLKQYLEYALELGDPSAKILTDQSQIAVMCMTREQDQWVASGYIDITLRTDIDVDKVQEIFMQVWSEFGCEFMSNETMNTLIENVSDKILQKILQMFPDLQKREAIKSFRANAITSIRNLQVTRQGDYVRITSRPEPQKKTLVTI